MEIIRMHYHFYGCVQGVGFRFRASHAAKLYNLTGWVRNEWDGSVELELQGPSQDIEQAVSAIFSSPYIQISRTEDGQIPAVAENVLSVRW